MKTREPRPEKLAKGAASDEDATDNPMARFKRLSRAVLTAKKSDVDAADRATKRKKKR